MVRMRESFTGRFLADKDGSAAWVGRVHGQLDLFEVSIDGGREELQEGSDAGQRTFQGGRGEAHARQPLALFSPLLHPYSCLGVTHQRRNLTDPRGRSRRGVAEVDSNDSSRMVREDRL